MSKVSFDPELRKIVYEVAEIWTDHNLLNFLEKHYNEVYDAMLAFLIESTWMSLGVLSDLIWLEMPNDGKGRVIPSVFHNLLCTIEECDLGRGL